jgi:DNA polymerase (family 10)
VLKGIGFLKRARGRRLVSQARAAAERCLGRLQREPAALRLAVAGPVRRMVATVEGVDLVATAHDPAALLATFVGMTFVAKVVAQGPGSASVVLEDGTPVALTVVPEEAFFAALFVRTGSPAHVARVAEAVAAKGRTLTERGLLEGPYVVRLEDEDDAYAAAGLPPVPPELRDEAPPRRPPTSSSRATCAASCTPTPPGATARFGPRWRSARPARVRVVRRLRPLHGRLVRARLTSRVRRSGRRSTR